MTCIRLSVDRAIALRRTTHTVIVKSVAHYESIYAFSELGPEISSYGSPSVLKLMLTFGLFERDGTFFALVCIQVGRGGLLLFLCQCQLCDCREEAASLYSSHYSCYSTVDVHRCEGVLHACQVITLDSNRRGGFHLQERRRESV